ncbi:MAG: NapC/NirT family cytochrome c, partial [Pseudomonadota bacterium]
RHEKGRREGMTCIDCHFAIAHKEPEGDKGPRDIVVKKK